MAEMIDLIRDVSDNNALDNVGPICSTVPLYWLASFGYCDIPMNDRFMNFEKW